MEYNLNQGQKAAADAFFDFLMNPDQKEFIIAGAAGVGKTYLMSYFIDNVIPKYHKMCDLVGLDHLYNQVVMTATTNKAAEVLSLATKRPTSTIHSFLNLKVANDFETGISKLNKTKNWVVHTNKVIFIDECSMIDKELYTLIDEGTFNCKIIFVGDHNQLAPVTEELSPVYMHDSPFYELTEPMRNNGQPALMAICQQLRETVATGIFKPINITPGVIDFLNGDDMEFQINQHFKGQDITKRILAYSNKRVVQYNDHIRAIRGLPDTYTVGELLVNASPIKLGSSSTMLSVEQGVTVEAVHEHDQQVITPDVKLDVQYIDIKSDLGITYRRAPIPTNREHYNELLKYFKKNKNFERFYYMKDSYPDLRPRDAATVYKAQGSTYDTVFIDLGDISRSNMSTQVARMLYVAFSRARQNVYLYGQLSSKYGGVNAA